MYVLGISCYYHDAAAALIEDGRLLSAAQEERFSRIKHDPSFPQRAIDLIPAITHVDGTGRLQTVHRDLSPRYYRLIEKVRGGHRGARDPQHVVQSQGRADRVVAGGRLPYLHAERHGCPRPSKRPRDQVTAAMRPGRA